MKREFVVLILLLISILFISGCVQKECKTDAGCPAKTCFTAQCADNKCMYSRLNGKQPGCSGDVSCGGKTCKDGACEVDYEKNCCGNKICEVGEIYPECAADCQNCDDTNECTKDSYDYHEQKCIHEPIIPCCGNGICDENVEAYLDCPKDCPDCDDNNKLTTDSFNYKTQKCKNIVTHYFIDDFEGDTQDWEFSEPTAWGTIAEDSNTVLKGTGHYWARLKEKEWADYIFRARFKIIKGTIHFNYRTRAPDRYFIGVESTNIYLNKQINKSFYDFVGKETTLGHGWHAIEIKGSNNIISVYIDGELLIEYKDTENPIYSGGIAFETLGNSEFLIDDVEIKLIAEENVIEEDCPYECCIDDSYNSKTCPAGYKCQENVCVSRGGDMEILKDTGFEWGFAEFQDGNLPEDEMCGMPAQGKEPAWAIAEIATETHFCKNLPNPKSTEPAITFESAGGHKKFYSYKDGRIKLQLDSSTEEKQGCEITNPIVAVTSWPHYGVRQYMLVDFADFEELNFKADVKLNRFKPNIPDQDCTQYGASVEKYGEFLIVFLLRRKGGSDSPKDLFWLLLPTCQKHWPPGAYEHGESGDKDCTSNDAEYIMNDQFEIPMYHPAMKSQYYPVLKEGEWVAYNFDLKELAEEAVRYYNSEYEPDLDLYDYNLAHAAFDWEMIGAFDTDIELKGLSLKGKVAGK